MEETNIACAIETTVVAPHLDHPTSTDTSPDKTQPLLNQW
jgi:hypothetical protein